ncbi:DH domain-containing protein [Balamuthia mandrillaris]
MTTRKPYCATSLGIRWVVASKIKNFFCRWRRANRSVMASLWQLQVFLGLVCVILVLVPSGQAFRKKKPDFAEGYGGEHAKVPSPVDLTIAEKMKVVRGHLLLKQRMAQASAAKLQEAEDANELDNAKAESVSLHRLAWMEAERSRQALEKELAELVEKEEEYEEMKEKLEKILLELEEYEPAEKEMNDILNAQMVEVEEKLNQVLEKIKDTEDEFDQKLSAEQNYETLEEELKELEELEEEFEAEFEEVQAENEGDEEGEEDVFEEDEEADELWDDAELIADEDQEEEEEEEGNEYLYRGDNGTDEEM